MPNVTGSFSTGSGSSVDPNAGYSVVYTTSGAFSPDTSGRYFNNVLSPSLSKYGAKAPLYSKTDFDNGGQNVPLANNPLSHSTYLWYRTA